MKYLDQCGVLVRIVPQQSEMARDRGAASLSPLLVVAFLYLHTNLLTGLYIHASLAQTRLSEPTKPTFASLKIGYRSYGLSSSKHGYLLHALIFYGTSLDFLSRLFFMKPRMSSFWAG